MMVIPRRYGRWGGVLSVYSSGKVVLYDLSIVSRASNQINLYTKLSTSIHSQCF